jgi:ABC-2 type transport system ATP-binding protein
MSDAPQRNVPPDGGAPVLAAEGLRKAYGDVVAVDDVSFRVERGEIVGLLGPNGAGKTTTIDMVLGVLAPDAGRIRVEGLDLATHRAVALERMNFAAVYSPLPGNLTVVQNLRVFGLIYSVPRLRERIEELLVQYDLVGFRDTRSGVLSSGEQTRLSLAKAVLNRPHLLVLDEPTASLDPSSARDMRARIRGSVGRETGGVLWTSHNMSEVVEVCDRVLFMSRGRVLLEGDPRALPAEHGKASLEELFITVAREPLTLAQE